MSSKERGPRWPFGDSGETPSWHELNDTPREKGKGTGYKEVKASGGCWTLEDTCYL